MIQYRNFNFTIKIFLFYQKLMQFLQKDAGMTVVAG
jgi:hypothetical protein